jgi:hypothetical protein
VFFSTHTIQFPEIWGSSWEPDPYEIRVSVPAAAAAAGRAEHRSIAPHQKIRTDWKGREIREGWREFMGISCSEDIAMRIYMIR